MLSAKFTIRTSLHVAEPTIFTTRISCGCIVCVSEFTKETSVNPTTICRNYLCVGAQLRSPSTYISVGVHLHVAAELQSPSTYLSEFIYVLQLNHEVRQAICRNSSTCQSLTTKSASVHICRSSSTCRRSATNHRDHQRTSRNQATKSVASKLSVVGSQLFFHMDID